MDITMQVMDIAKYVILVVYNVKDLQRMNVLNALTI